MERADNRKRIICPLGRVIELIRGQDGKDHILKLQTMHSLIIRLILRIYPLEVSSVAYTDNNFSKLTLNENQIDPLKLESQITKTRSGRVTKIPEILNS